MLRPPWSGGSHESPDSLSQVELSGKPSLRLQWLHRLKLLSRLFRRIIDTLIGEKSNSKARWLAAVVVLSLAILYGTASNALSWAKYSIRGHQARNALDGTSHRRTWAFSHNDEAQGDQALVSVPNAVVFDGIVQRKALDLGLGGIEVDVWLSSRMDVSCGIPRSILGNESHFCLNHYTIDVGHRRQDIVPGRTLAQVYLDPLMELLDRRNDHRTGSENWTGVYADDPQAELVLAIDMKGDGEEMWPHMVRALDPLRSKGYLTTYDDSAATWRRGPILVVGTGSTPLSRVVQHTPRSIFYDAPLRNLNSPQHVSTGHDGSATAVEFTPSISPMASAKLPILYHLGLLFPKQRPFNPVLELLQLYANDARRRGIEPRWWGVSRHPWILTKGMWKLLKRSGNNWINSDDLLEVSGWLQRWEAKQTRKGAWELNSGAGL